jgi:glycosyltransferase involved in cell wall biosynthesis
MSLRLGFVTARAVRATSHGLTADPGLGRLVDAVAERAAQLTLSAPVFTQAHETYTHTLETRTRDFVPLPELWSFKEGVRLHVPVRTALAQVEARSDVVIVQLPFATPSALLGARAPRVYHVCADTLAIVRDAPHYRGLARLPALGAAHAVDQLYHRLVARADTAAITHGRAILERYAPRRGQAVVSSTLRADELGSVPRRRAPDGRFRVVFVGHLRPEKGLDVLVDALERVRARLPGVELYVVGPPIDPTITERLSGLAQAGVLHLVGHRAFGPALFQELADADVLALPSFSEGTPRVLVEARAFGCPVVASDVGGIPTSVTHERDGLLVPPRDPAALAAAILRLAEDPALHARLVAEGYRRAAAATVDALAQTLVSAAAELYAGAR